MDFTNPANKLRDDSQHLNNQPNIAHQSKPVTDVLDAKTGPKKIKIRSPDKLILGHVNINSIRNKFHSLIYILDKNIAIFLISETKLDDSFSSAQFKIEGFTTLYRYNRNHKESDLLLYIREDIPSRLLQCKSQSNIESFSVDINLRKRKWFLNFSYNPHRNSISSHLECLNRVIDKDSKTYDNFIFIGDFNVGIDENSMKNLCDTNCFKSLIKQPICTKNPDKPTCINVILTNWSNLYQHSSTFEIGLSEIHLLTVTEFRMGFQKLKPKITTY